MLIHVDMDAFYASVEERENPSLRGRPLVVGGRPERRGVVSAANYAARAYGIRSAMPMAHAVRLCRDLLILPVRMSMYADVSRQIREMFHRYTPLVEPLSLDEAFLDTRASTRLHGPPAQVAQTIRQAIGHELGLVASVGVAPNKFLAKLASDHDKPDGFTVVEPDAVQAFLDPMPVERLWGVGAATLARLHALDIHCIRDERQADEAQLEQIMGVGGSRLYRLAHGLDDRPVRPEHESKSISHETTFAEDVTDQDVLDSVLMELTESVCERLRGAGLEGRTITLKLRDATFRTTTASRSLPARTQSTGAVWRVARSLLGERYRPASPVRLIGIGVSRFDADGGGQIDLFAEPASRREATVDALTDRIRSRFGRGAIGRGTRLRPER